MTLPSGTIQSMNPQYQAFLPYAGTEAPYAKTDATSPGFALNRILQEDNDQRNKRDYVAQLQAGRDQIQRLTQMALAQQLAESRIKGASDIVARRENIPWDAQTYRFITGEPQNGFLGNSQEQLVNNQRMTSFAKLLEGLGNYAQHAGGMTDLNGLSPSTMLGLRFQQGTPTAVQAAAAGAAGRNQPTTTYTTQQIDPNNPNVLTGTQTKIPGGAAPQLQPVGGPQPVQPQHATVAPSQQTQSAPGGANPPPSIALSHQVQNGTPMIVGKMPNGQTAFQFPAAMLNGLQQSP